MCTYRARWAFKPHFYVLRRVNAEVENLKLIRKISYLDLFSVTGKVYAFGEGQRGQLGLEKVMERCTEPTLVASLHGQVITKVSCGECHSAAVNGLSNDVFVCNF